MLLTISGSTLGIKKSAKHFLQCVLYLNSYLGVYEYYLISFIAILSQ